jgi:hypothetical protein
MLPSGALQVGQIKTSKWAKSEHRTRRVPPSANIASIAIYFLIVTSNQAILFCLPSITDNMKGMSISWRTVVTVLPDICSIAGILLDGYSASRTGERRWHTAVPILLAAISLALAILGGDHVALVIAFFCLVGFSFPGTSAGLLDPSLGVPRQGSRRDGNRDDQLVRQSRRVCRAEYIWVLEDRYPAVRRWIMVPDGMHARLRLTSEPVPCRKHSK